MLRGLKPLAKSRPLPPLRLACFCRRQRLGCAATDIDTLDAFEYTIERERARLLKL